MRQPGFNTDWMQSQSDSLLALNGLDETLEEIRDRLITEGRITGQDGLALLLHEDLGSILSMADICKRARFGKDIHFNLNIHVNQTNICVLACKFCAFRRGRRATDAYAMDIEKYISEIEPYSEIIDEVHSVGGLHPDWDVGHYCELFRRTKQRFPELHIKALTAVEIKHIASLSNISISDTLEMLSEAGLGSLPGGGAEILVDSVREKICKGKESSKEYLDIHRSAHNLDIPTNCTMLFGTVETPEERIEHLLKLRELQDETNGFQCFVPYPFLPDSTRLPEAQLASANEILRMIAISRLMLDNIPHIKAYRMNIGDAITEMAISCGADDVDGTVLQESIMHLAGSTAPLDHGIDDMCRLIERSGCDAVRRNTVYNKFERVIADRVSRRRSLPMVN